MTNRTLLYKTNHFLWLNKNLTEKPMATIMKYPAAGTIEDAKGVKVALGVGIFVILALLLLV